MDIGPSGAPEMVTCRPEVTTEKLGRSTPAGGFQTFVRLALQHFF